MFLLIELYWSLPSPLGVGRVLMPIAKNCQMNRTGTLQPGGFTSLCYIVSSQRWGHPCPLKSTACISKHLELACGVVLMTASWFSSDQEQPRIIGYALDFRVKETSSGVLAEALSMAPGTIWDLCEPGKPMSMHPVPSRLSCITSVKAIKMLWEP